MSTKKKSLVKNQKLTEYLLYKSPGGEIKVEVLLRNETIWLPQKQMAELFNVNVPAISKHLNNIFEVFDAPGSHEELEQMIDTYDPKKEGIMTLITSYSNATFFITFKLR